MKTVVKVFILFITAIISAQNSIEKNVGDFTELKVYDLIEVNLVKSKSNKVIITGENKEDVQIINKNGILKIKMKLEEIFDGNDTKIILHYTGLDIIDVNEGAKVYSEDTIKQYEIDLKAQEGGIIKIPINVTYTNIRAVTGGNIEASGKSKSQKISILTGGIYNGKELETENTEVAIRAAGEASVKASKQVDVKVRAGGNVFIYGKPEIVNESKVFGGRIRKMN